MSTNTIYNSFYFVCMLFWIGVRGVFQWVATTLLGALHLEPWERFQYSLTALKPTILTTFSCRCCCYYMCVFFFPVFVVLLLFSHSHVTYVGIFIPCSLQSSQCRTGVICLSRSKNPTDFLRFSCWSLTLF